MTATADPLAPGGVERRLDDLLERCFDLALRTDVVDGGRGVVGYFPVCFPEEIVHAAGLRPQPVHGGGTTVEVRQADALLGSFVCSICRSTTELGLDGSLARLAACFVPSISDPAKHLVSLWSHNFPDVPARLFHVPQNLSSPAAAEFLAGEYREIAAVMAGLGGRRVAADEPRRSIAVYNERRRRLIGELYQLRRDQPQRLSAAECYPLLRAGAQLRCEDHNAVLSEALGLLRERPALLQDKPKVVLFGGSASSRRSGCWKGSRTPAPSSTTTSWLACAGCAGRCPQAATRSRLSPPPTSTSPPRARSSMTTAAPSKRSWPAWSAEPGPMGRCWPWPSSASRAWTTNWPSPGTSTGRTSPAWSSTSRSG